MKDNRSGYQKTWDLLQELIESMKKTDRQMEETDRQVNKVSKDIDKFKESIQESMKESIKEADRRMEGTDRQINKVSKSIDKLKKTVGGIGNSNGYVAEDLFYNSLKKNMSIGNITFDFIDRNMERTHKGLTDEFDIILTNSNLLVIVEVKYNYHPNDVEAVLKKIKNFRKLFPLYNDYKVFGAIAGLTMSPKTINLAKKYGFFVLAQEGNKLKILNDNVSEYLNTDQLKTDIKQIKP
ncbi:hypothetical protein MHK_006873 [Candidatus Magnetomorum sp. HK-1]|nr:hypothetical protein MHK_006873 [Candidatus Magnetomorum sp. HK-1]